MINLDEGVDQLRKWYARISYGGTPAYSIARLRLCLFSQRWIANSESTLPVLVVM